MDRQTLIRKKFDELYARYRGQGINDLEYFVSARVAEHFLNTEGVSSDEIFDEIGIVMFHKKPKVETKRVEPVTEPTAEEVKPVTEPTVEEVKPVTEPITKKDRKIGKRSGGIKLPRDVTGDDITKFAVAVGVGIVVGIVAVCACSSKKHTVKRSFHGHHGRAAR